MLARDNTLKFAGPKWQRFAQLSNMSFRRTSARSLCKSQPLKRHHTRLMPLPGSVRQTRNGIASQAQSRNLASHLRILDWFQQSHNALQGTARPARYHVLGSGILDTNGKPFTFQGPSGSCKQRLNALFIVYLLITSQQMHALCYTYVGATMGASCMPPAYYADLLAERGRSKSMEHKDCIRKL